MFRFYSQAYDNLYKNTDGLADAWGKFWAEFSRRHTDSKTGLTDGNVLGVELINEPFAGNFYQNPMLAVPRMADGWNLQPGSDVFFLLR